MKRAYSTMSLATMATLAALAATPAMASDKVITGGAPAASPDALYCLRVEPVIGSRIESVECHTRAYWAEFDIDIDSEWPTEGVRVIGG